MALMKWAGPTPRGRVGRARPGPPSSPASALPRLDEQSRPPAGAVSISTILREQNASLGHPELSFPCCGSHAGALPQRHCQASEQPAQLYDSLYVYIYVPLSSPPSPIYSPLRVRSFCSPPAQYHGMICGVVAQFLAENSESLLEFPTISRTAAQGEQREQRAPHRGFSQSRGLQNWARRQEKKRASPVGESVRGVADDPRNTRGRPADLRILSADRKW